MSVDRVFEYKCADKFNKKLWHEFYIIEPIFNISDLRELEEKNSKIYDMKKIGINLSKY